MEQEHFYRYMSRDEAEAVGEPGDTGLLRDGRPGQTHWTSNRYESVGEAKSYLALKTDPEVRMKFTILTWPSRLLKRATTVTPTEGEAGGGVEWMTDEIVEVRVEDVDDLK